MHITEVLYKPFWFYLLVPLLNASILLMCKRSLQASSKYCCSAYLSINGIGQCVNVFVAKPDSLSAVPRTLALKDNHLLQLCLAPPLACCGTCACAWAHAK